MSLGSARKALIAAVLPLVLAPASASAYTVTIHIHGAGTVSEVTNRTGGSRNLAGCTISPTGRTNSSTTDCVMGNATGLWNSFDIVRLGESVDATANARGWHFDHWHDSSANGFVNCDPQESTGNFSNLSYCEFQIFDNLQVDLWFEDDTGPSDTAINGGPTQGSTTSSTTAQFTSFSAASDPDATFQCKLDPPGSLGSWGSCAKNGAQFTNLTQNGTWQLNVRGVDPSGNVDTTPAVRSWVVDTTPPVVNLTNGPANGSRTNATTADFNVSTSDGNLVCTIDGATLSSCAPPTVHLSGLGEAQHTFSVRGVDAVGNSSTAITRTWTVDTTPPTVTLTGGPTGTTKATTASFTVTTDDGTPACTLDGASTPCAGAHNGLADGSHTFTASATDTAGNSSSATPRTWTVDTTPPTLTVTGGPAGTTNATGATFTVTTNEGTPSCTLDGDDAPCAGAHDGLQDGSHTFVVTATDAVGNTSAPVIRHWTVDTVAPVVTLNGSPDSGSTSTTFTFTSNEDPATFECKLDLAAFAPCTSPTTLSNLPNGDHAFSVRAVDAAGNASQPLVRSWSLNTKDQDHDGFDSGTDCDDAKAAIHPGADDTPDDGIDQDCSGKDAHNADQDGDGVIEGADCNDHSVAIHPGAADIPGDGIDQDCNGADATVSRVPGGIRYRFSTHGAKTTIAVLKLTQLTAPKTRVTVTCKGKGCKFRTRTGKPARSHTLDLRKLLRRAPLKAGQTLTVKISAPGFRSIAAKFTVRRGKLPKGGALRLA